MAHVSESDKEFEARIDMDTLKSAELIKADPKRRAAAEKAAKKEIAALRKLGGTLLTDKKKTLSGS